MLTSAVLFVAALFASSTVAAPSSQSFSKRAIPTTGGKPVLDDIDFWRAAYNVPVLNWSDQLAANAAKTGQDDGGVNENHELNPGSLAQVIVPGIDDNGVCGRDLAGQTPFGISYEAWLCEVPSDPQLGGHCPQWLSISHIDDSSGETGHHDILISTSYSQIGCAFTRNPNAAQCDTWTGLWICDLA